MSRIRVIWKQGTTIYVGQRAITQLAKLASLYLRSANVPVLTAASPWKNAISLENQLRRQNIIDHTSRLLVYREPRHVGTKNSRYKQALRTLGIPQPRQEPPRRACTPRGIPPKAKRPSRTVSLLEQELLRRGDDF